MNTYQNKLYIVANLLEKRYYKGVKNCIDTLINNGFSCVLNKEDYKKLYKKTYKKEIDIEDCDYICSLGGDGTLLLAGKLAIKYDKPIFGINFGHVGYYCLYDKSEVASITPASLAKKKVKEEPLLEFKNKSKIYYAINDVVVGKDDFGSTIDIGAYINDKEVCSFRGDGIILATPFGSSAYNKSCKGNVIKRGGGYFVLTAICPSYSDFDSKSFKDNKNCLIKLNSKKKTASIYVDGKRIASLKDELKINKSSKKIRIIS